MSELISTSNGRRDLRWQLLASVSGAALLITILATGTAEAADGDADHPTVWIELGGQLEALSGQGEAFSAPFLTPATTPVTFTHLSPLKAERPPLFSFGPEASVSFEPSGTDWVISASARYGRANGDKNDIHRTRLGLFHSVERFYGCNYSGVCGATYPDRGYKTEPGGDFARAVTKHDQSHLVLDFMAGKELGIGMFGREASSIFSLGVRFAQFNLKSSVELSAETDDRVVTQTANLPNRRFAQQYYHMHALSAQSAHNFHGVGPSVFWKASAPFVGNAATTEFTFDWGANAAILFGRQRMSAQHLTSGHYCHINCANASASGVIHQQFPSYVHSGARNNQHAVTIPNAGGFAGISLKFPNAKVSLGYRADFFFGAIDGGIDTRKEETLGMYGPFATISVGMGG